MILAHTRGWTRWHPLGKTGERGSAENPNRVGAKLPHGANIMTSPIHNMNIIRHYRDDRPHSEERVLSPSWAEVEAAIRRMDRDNGYIQIVQLNCTADGDDDDIFNVISGNGNWVPFQMSGEWEYDDPAGGDDMVSLWGGDRRPFCEGRNALADVEKVLKLTRAFYDSGSYERLDEVALSMREG